MVLGVYTSSIESIYLSLRAQVAVGTFFMKSPVLQLQKALKRRTHLFNCIIKVAALPKDGNVEIEAIAQIGNLSFIYIW